MPRKNITHPFQLELLRQQKDKARIERELKLRQRIYTFAELSDKERKRRFAFLIAEKQRAAQQSESSDESELDSDSSLDSDTINESSFPNLRGELKETLRFSRVNPRTYHRDSHRSVLWSRIFEPIHLPYNTYGRRKNERRFRAGTSRLQ